MTDRDLLIVDDEPVVVDAARRVLEPEGLRVSGVGDGAAALDEVRRGGFELVLLDLMLPGVPGMELLDRLVAEHPSTPVIVTTGYASARKCVEVLRAGAFDFLPKPFDVDELLGVVRRGLHFGRRPATEQMPWAPDGRERSTYFLGTHSWARIEEDGLATLGLAESFQGAIGTSPGVHLNRAGSETLQGESFARIEDVGPRVHRVWSPLSGRIVSVNPRLESDPGLVERSPFDAGWLSRISPTNLREELDELSLR